MANRPDTLEAVQLALELLRRIPRNRKISASELHEQLTNTGFTRDPRIIQRQLEILSEHFDIERDDASKPYGYQWKERAEGLSLPGLSEQESLLLALAEQHLRNLLPTNLLKSMDGFFRQARLNLGPHTAGKPAKDWLSKVRVVSVTRPLLPPKIKPGAFEAVSNALYANCWLMLDYMNAGGKRNKARVMPLRLAQPESSLYLVCRCEGYDNERNFALHRIVSAEVTSIRVERPKDFDLQKYVADGKLGFGQGQRIRLTFWIRKSEGQYLLESSLSEDQQVRERGAEFEITATVVDTAQLEWWMRGFGDAVHSVKKVLLD